MLGTEDPYTLSQEDFNIWMAKRALAESPGENLSGPSKRSRTMPAGVQHGTPYPVPLAGGTAPANRPLPLHARNTRSRTAAMTPPDSRSAAPAVPEPQRKSATTCLALLPSQQKGQRCHRDQVLVHLDHLLLCLHPDLLDMTLAMLLKHLLPCQHLCHQ